MCTAAAGQHALLRSQPLWTDLFCPDASTAGRNQLVCSTNLLCAHLHLLKAAVLAGLADLARWPAVQDLLLPLVVDLRRTNMLSHAVHHYIESVTVEAKQSIRSATLCVAALSGQSGSFSMQAPALVNWTGR